ncbi:DNA repair protein [Sphingomonas koreensis]|nr:DNA repair protein [Sphingomonas koreensis]
MAGIRRIGDLGAAFALFAPIAREPIEVAAFAYLDPEWRLLGMRHTRSACRSRVDISLRAIATDALVLDCAGVVMAHNHPGADPAPSEADRAITRQLARTLDSLGVRLLDHLVLAGDAVTSFRTLGLL